MRSFNRVGEWGMAGVGRKAHPWEGARSRRGTLALHGIPVKTWLSRGKVRRCLLDEARAWLLGELRHGDGTVPWRV